MYGIGRRDYRHTEHFPTLAQSLPVLRVDDEHDGVTIVVVPMPDGAYSALSSQVPELEDCGRESDLPHYPGHEGFSGM